jgi:hypothetical protein
MAHWKKGFPSRYLQVSDLDMPIVATIANTKSENVGLGGFARAIARGQTVAKVDHAGKPFARQDDGTLELEERSSALHMRARLTSRFHDQVERWNMAGRLQGWSPGWTTRRAEDAGDHVRVLEVAEFVEISLMVADRPAFRTSRALYVGRCRVCGDSLGLNGWMTDFCARTNEYPLRYERCDWCATNPAAGVERRFRREMDAALALRAQM